MAVWAPSITGLRRDARRAVGHVGGDAGKGVGVAGTLGGCALAQHLGLAAGLPDLGHQVLLVELVPDMVIQGELESRQQAHTVALAMAGLAHRLQFLQPHLGTRLAEFRRQVIARVVIDLKVGVDLGLGFRLQVQVGLLEIVVPVAHGTRAHLFGITVAVDMLVRFGHAGRRWKMTVSLPAMGLKAEAPSAMTSTCLSSVCSKK